MMITDRQKEILNRIVGEYVNSAQPVSSQLLERDYNFGICPATIRIEMQKLTDRGFIYQPYTSAGRVPTDKGYRFFVDEILARPNEEDFEMENLIEKEIKDTMRFVQSLTKSLSTLSSNLALGYLFNKKILWKDGWEEILQEPEFREAKIISNFTVLIKNFEKDLESLEINSGIKIYIGKENPFSKSKDFSTIITRCQFPNKEEGILAILGPKRMSYQKNISLINSLTKILEEF